MPVKNNHAFLLAYIICMALMMIFAFSWNTATLDGDSYMYAATARHVAATGQWLNIYDPSYDGQFYYHFPLVIWLTALLFKFFGTGLFTAKLFSMLSALFAAILIFYFGRRLKNDWVGFFAGWSFLLTNHIARLSRQCRMDLPVTFFIALAMFAFYLAQKGRRGYYILFGLAGCLAIFSKDIVGTAPLVIAVLYLAARFRFKEIFHPLFVAGCIISLAPVLGWIFLEHKLYGSTLFDKWYVWNFKHVAFSPSFADRFDVPWYYYIRALLDKYWYFLPFALHGGYLAAKEEFKGGNRGWLIPVIWAAFFPFAFSFGAQKLHYFILPMYPASALLAGLSLNRILSEGAKFKFAKAVKYIIITMTLLMLCLPLKLYKPRFEEVFKMAPAINAALKQAGDHELMVCKVDRASAFFYLPTDNYRYFKDALSLEQALSAPSLKARFIYMPDAEFQKISEGLRRDLRVLCRYKEHLFVTDSKTISAHLP